MPRKNEFNILIAFLHISGLLIYLKLNIKKQFLKNYQKTYDSTMIFWYIFINRIQPFEAANISAAFFLCRPMRKNNRCHTFQNKFQDDFSCSLDMYSYIWDSLYIWRKTVHSLLRIVLHNYKRYNLPKKVLCNFA